MRIPSRAEIDVEKIRRGGLYEFVKRAWHIVEPIPYIDNWHIEEKCKLLEAVSRGKCKEAIINEPPGSGKSLVVSVLWPVWEWACISAETRWIFASFDIALTRRDAGKAVTLITSDWFKERYGVALAERMGGPPRERVALTEFYTTAGGFRYSTSCPLGKVTGRHAHRHVIDDPIKPATAEAASFAVSDKALQDISNWKRNTLSTRASDPKNLSTVLIMQRVHENDLTGEMLRNNPQAAHLRFPARFEADDPSVTPFARDRRTQEGELIWPQRVDDETLSKTEHDMGGKGSMTVAAQLQQRPTSRGGQIFKKDWFQYWEELPKGFGRFVQSWDLTFKAEGTSRVCGDLWLIFGTKCFLVDWICKQMSFTESLAEIEKRCTTDTVWRKAGTKLIENKANGPAVISVLQNKITGIIPVEPQGSKEERANAVTPVYEAKNVYHPHPSIRPDIKGREKVLLDFPRARWDDEVDATSMFLLYFIQNSSNLAAAMGALKAPGVFGMGSR